MTTDKSAASIAVGNQEPTPLVIGSITFSNASDISTVSKSVMKRLESMRPRWTPDCGLCREVYRGMNERGLSVNKCLLTSQEANPVTCGAFSSGCEE